MEDGQQLHSPSFSSLAAVYIFLFTHLRVKYNAFRKFSPQNIFVRKRNDENFSHELFGIEINANENKANYGTLLAIEHSYSI